MASTINTTAIFLRPFELASFNEALPAGEYRIETELLDPLDCIKPETWTSSVLVHLHPRVSHPGLSRTLTVPSSELEHAIARDKLTGKALKDYFLEEMLADPMICLVMRADGVTEEEVRCIYSTPVHRRSYTEAGMNEPGFDADNEGRAVTSPGRGSSRPGVGE